MDVECIISGPYTIKAKALIQNDVYMKFYNETKPLYFEMDVSGIGLGAALFQTRDGTTCSKDAAPDNTILRPIAFSSKSLTIAEQGYSNIEREVLGILHGLEEFHHYCSAREVSIITNHKTLVAVFKKSHINPVTRNPVHPAMDTPILGGNNIPAETKAFHHRLAVQTQSHREQR